MKPFDEYKAPKATVKSEIIDLFASISPLGMIAIVLCIFYFAMKFAIALDNLAMAGI